MQKKTMFKTLSVFMLALFVMSMTGAAACSGSSCSASKTCSGSSCSVSKPVAKADTFNFSPYKSSGNVLSNDKGTGLKVVSISKTTKGGKVSMKSNGSFSYKPASSYKTGTIRDSFTYKVADKSGRYTTAKVTITYKFR
ncbi:MAG: Ig-like domain-containing protein [Methanosarcina sp.]|nr:hypothetical protein BGV40_04095 [Methanosarcina sp. Ant1]